MATLLQIGKALKKAHDAGDAENARILANAYRQKKAEIEGLTMEGLTPDLSTDPTSGNNFIENAAAGLGSRMNDAWRGLKTGVAEGSALVSSPAALLAQQFIGTDALAPQAQALRAEHDEARRTDAPLMNTAGGITGYGAGVIGELLVPGAGLKAAAAVPQFARAAPMLEGAASAFLPSTIRGAGAQGATLGAIAPVGEGESRAVNVAVGAGSGVVGASLVSGAVKALQWARQMMPAASKAAQERAAAQALLELSDDPAAVQAALAQARNAVPEIVPGSRPSTAELTGDLGLAGAERSMRTVPKFAPRFQASDEARNGARVGLIRRLFGGATPEAEAAARAGVQRAQGPAIKEAMKQVGAETGRVIRRVDRMANSPTFRGYEPVTRLLQTIRSRLATPIDDAGRLSAGSGVLRSAIGAGRRMSSADRDLLLEARRLVIGAQRAGQTADEVLAQVKKLKPKSLTAQITLSDAARALRIAEKGKPDVASLYNLRKTITGQMMKGADPQQMRALRTVIASLDDEISAVAPTYKQYLSEYAEGMTGANQIKVGTSLVQKGQPTPGLGAEFNLTPGAFNRSTVNMDEFVQRATGFRRARAKTTLTHEQRQAVDAIRRDLARWNRVQTARPSKNSQSAENLLGVGTIQSHAGPVGAAMIEPASGAGMLFLNAARKKYGEQVAQILFEAMDNPQRAAEILATLPPGLRQRLVQEVGPYLSASVRVAGEQAALAGSE